MAWSSKIKGNENPIETKGKDSRDVSQCRFSNGGCTPSSGRERWPLLLMPFIQHQWRHRRRRRPWRQNMLPHRTGQEFLSTWIDTLVAKFIYVSWMKCCNGVVLYYESTPWSLPTAFNKQHYMELQVLPILRQFEIKCWIQTCWFRSDGDNGCVPLWFKTAMNWDCVVAAPDFKLSRTHSLRFGSDWQFSSAQWMRRCIGIVLGRHSNVIK